MGRYEVTQREYEKVTGSNPSFFQSAGQNAPVETVTWRDAMDFCKKLTVRARKNGSLPEGWEFNLPTEIQWEHGYRAGSKKTNMMTRLV